MEKTKYPDDVLRIEYIPDSKVGAPLDAELRALLSSCFNREGDALFRHQRFHQEMPPHRWLGRDEQGQLVAHLAVHDKILGTTTGDLRVGGVADVCVTPAQRRRGFVRRLLAEGHDWMIAQGIPFGALFGDAKVYSSSGYRTVDNPLRYLDTKTGEWLTEPFTYFFVKPLASIPWPPGMIDLRGPKF